MSNHQNIARAMELAYNIAFGAGIVITREDEMEYALQYYREYPAAEKPLESRMMNIIAADLAA